MIWKIFLIIDLCFHLVAIFEGKLLISSHENWFQIDVNSQTYLIVCHIRIPCTLKYILNLRLFLSFKPIISVLFPLNVCALKMFFDVRFVFWIIIYLVKENFYFSIIVPLSFLKHWPNNTTTKTMMAMMTLAIEKQWVECRKSQ